MRPIFKGGRIWIRGCLKLSRAHQITYFLAILYIVLICLFMVWHHLWFSPDQFFVFGIFGAVFLGSFWQFLKDWTPFVFSFLSYEFLRGLAPLLNNKVHINEMIDADMKFFGFIPTLKLQEALFHPNNPQWYDVAAVILYSLHFIVPMMAAFIFWVINKEIFREFAIALIALSFMAYITYVAYPAMPPWLASNKGYLPPLTKVLDNTIVQMGHPMTMPTIYSLFRGDEVAAVPSLHAAYPLLVMLFCIKQFKKWGFLLLPYVMGVWFTVIYGGEHYFIDVLLGALYALVVFIVVANRQRFSVKIFPLSVLKT
ncbi:phosphatase PAP2 family protein [Candidatus Woesebacteria bacterium]|nr:phosphatase PAP2 family protein [Candidatus Woesebacteria bacterium]